MIMKKRSVLVLTILCMLLLSACGEGMTLQTEAGVKQVLVDRGIFDENNEYRNTRIAADTYYVLCKNKWSVTFEKYVTVSDCVSEYAMGHLLLDDAVERKEANYAILEGKQGEDTYKLIIRVEDTLLIIAGPDTAKEDLQELAKDLGYYK